MDTLSYKTISANKFSVEKEWFVVDATNEVVGRLSAKVALVLRGKHKTHYTPHADCGDRVVIINADKVKFTGKKVSDKIYLRHTGYPGGQRSATPSDFLAKKPEMILEHAIKGMLPKTKLGKELFRNVYIYAGEAHNQEAQSPKVLDLNTIK
ncbi:MAG: 50S ribosomal protein L13 [Bacteroidales bacterium]|nr:50S ribosomal protein L13 [Bacteroidales bacterium]